VAAATGQDAAMSDREQAQPEDETHRRFREALERKKAGGGSGGGPRPTEGGAHLKGSNDKRQRQFRRKSG
jgi:hypothetical protein